jgi:hypothetical protein
MTSYILFFPFICNQLFNNDYCWLIFVVLLSVFYIKIRVSFISTPYFGTREGDQRHQSIWPKMASTYSLSSFGNIGRNWSGRQYQGDLTDFLERRMRCFAYPVCIGLCMHACSSLHSSLQTTCYFGVWKDKQRKNWRSIESLCMYTCGSRPDFILLF